MKKMMEMFGTFARDEDGIALTEYLILLGILTSAVIVAVTVVGTQLGTAWASWSTWFSGADLDAPTV